jgi:hypothetical protein
MELDNLEEGDEIIVNDREEPMEVEEVKEPKADRNKIHLNVKGGDKFYAISSVFLSGSRGGKYHLYKDISGTVYISRAYSTKTKYDSYKVVKNLEEV